MERDIAAEVVCSSRFEDIKLERFDADWVVHLICLAGQGHFLYKGQEMALQANDCAVISHTALIGELHASPDLQVELVAAPMPLLRNQLPPNNYGLAGRISLYDNPVMRLNAQEAERLLQDFRHIRQRVHEPHAFYMEMMGSLLSTMMYDLFAFHARLYEGTDSSERISYIVKGFMGLLEAGESRRHRDVAYYAQRLCVSSKYLSDSVKKITGNSASYLIDNYTVPILIELLKDENLSLTQICDEMNFNSISYFSRYCAKHLGLSPKAYRSSAARRRTQQ